VGLINALNGHYVPFSELSSEYKKGTVSIMSQSGGIGFSLAERLRTPGLGLSKFISMGNKLNTDEADLLAYLDRDPDTEVIYCYLEGFKRGREFVEIALRSNKPIILHKSNTTPLSNTIARSHTAALAVDDKIVDSACAQSGIMRVQSVEEAVLAIKGISMPLLQGKNLAVLSRSGGQSVVGADMCAAYGFNLPQLHPEILEEVKSHFRAGVINIGNPLDLGDIFDFHAYSQIAEKIIQQPDIHGIVYIHVSQMAIENENSIQLIKKLNELSVKYDKPVAIVPEVPLFFRRMLMEKMTRVFFMDPVEAFRALTLQHQYAEFRQKKEHTVKRISFHFKDKVRTWVKGIQQKDRQPLLHEALDLLNRIGIPTAPWHMVTTFSEARNAANKMGYPVVIKAVTPTLLHKSDQGGIALNIRNAETLEKQWEEIHSRFKDIIGIVLQKMIFGSREIIIGAKRDPSFGPVVLVGMGGIMVEVMQDVSMRLAPIDEDDANEMMDQLQGAKVLGSFRGMKAVDRRLATRCLVEVSRLMHDLPEIQEVDVNPLILPDNGNGGMALDARLICSDFTAS
jgi:acetyltransferase